MCNYYLLNSKLLRRLSLLLTVSRLKFKVLDMPTRRCEWFILGAALAVIYSK
jgi:hypothetical protein